MACLLAGTLAGGLTLSAALRDASPAASGDGRPGRAQVALAASSTAAGGGQGLPADPAAEAVAAATRAAEAQAQAQAKSQAQAEAGAGAAVSRRIQAASRTSRSGVASRSALTRWPAAGALTGWYGERRGRRSHVGLDIDGTTGDPVWAAGPGTVVVAGWAPPGYGGYGRMVVIDHGGGLQTLYAHLSSVAVSPGQAVDAGAPVGAIGTSGSVTGSHLHFEVRLGGHPVDPRAWLPAR